MNVFNLNKFSRKINKVNILYLIILYIYIEIISLVFLYLLGLKNPNIVFINSKPINLRNRELISNFNELGWGSNDKKNSTLQIKNNCRIFLFGDSYIRMDIYKKINSYHLKVLSKLTR